MKRLIEMLMSTDEEAVRLALQILINNGHKINRLIPFIKNLRIRYKIKIICHYVHIEDELNADYMVFSRHSHSMETISIFDPLFIIRIFKHEEIS